MKLPQAIPLKPCTVSWFALLGLTTITYELSARAPGQALMALVLGVMLVKAHLIVSDFMGLRHTRLLWRIVMAAYLAVVGGIIAFTCLTA